MDADAFHADLSTILTDHPDMIVTKHNAHITSLLDKHAPVTKHIQKRKKITTWFTAEILVAKTRTSKSRTSWAEVRSDSARRNFHTEKTCSDTLSPES